MMTVKNPTHFSGGSMSKESGEFGEKYEQYRTHGDINNIQLYAEILN